MRVITGKVQANFDDWTSADTSRLFLSAFVVGAPFAATNKSKRIDVRKSWSKKSKAYQLVFPRRTAALAPLRQCTQHSEKTPGMGRGTWAALGYYGQARILGEIDDLVIRKEMMLFIEFLYSYSFRYDNFLMNLRDSNWKP